MSLGAGAAADEPLRLHACHPRGGFPGYATRLRGMYRLVAASDQPEAIIIEAGFNDRVAGHLERALADPACHAALRGGAILVLDSTQEGRPFDARVMERLRAMLAAAGVDAGACLKLTQNVNWAAHHAAWAVEQGIRRPVQVRVLHALLRGMVRRVRGLPEDRSPAALDWAGEGAPARFLCLNHRFAAHRMVVLGHLQARGAIGLGLVSAHRLPPHGHIPARWQATHGDRLAAFETLRPALPLRLPETPGTDYILGWEDRWFRETAFSLVTESEFLGPSIRRFTEKSLKPLAAGQPMLVAGQAGTLGLLRELGFHTFAPAIREDYDLIEEPAARMDAVLAEFDRLLGLPASRLTEMVRGLRPVLDHNMAWFRSGLPERLAQEDRELHATIARMARASADARRAWA